MKWTALLCIALIGNAARADDTRVAALQWLGLSGSLRTGYWSSNRSLDSLTNFAPTSIWLKAVPQLPDGIYVGGEGWLLDEAPFRSESRLRSDLPEGYVGWRNETVDIGIGRKVISWGRADLINPTDIVTSRDYTRMFVDDGDLRQAGVLANASYGFGDLTASALWLPEFRPNILPIAGMPGLEVKQGTDRLQNNQFAIRLDRTGSGFDWSVSYFNGLNRNPGSRLGSLSSNPVFVSAIYNRAQLIGADFATNLGTLGIRGELAYTQTSNPAGSIFNPAPAFEAVVGIETKITQNDNVGIQYLMRYNFLAHSVVQLPPVLARIADENALLNNQLIRIQAGPTLRITHTALNDALILELSVAIFGTDSSFFIRPRATYLVTDSVKIKFGADVYFGPPMSYFGYLHNNSGFLSEISFDF